MGFKFKKGSGFWVQGREHAGCGSILSLQGDG
eukprot:CAMPEP_0198680454 /NCGR_PEP_ID=MMETSP1468-20131203/4852_1 /TAXON_ID=1461545 /ORGANISM="Mantoniella sp, Strain CCMP1436" /LENGTH=31 /DNA_ID= /DNA_START= /DNA_END= /DNA_ORIENTATION=